MLIDLSVVLDQDTPAYPGDPTPEIEPAGTLNRDGFCDHVLTMGTHLGTHVDAPMHMIEGGQSLGSIDVGRWWGTGVLVPVRDGSFDAVLGLEVTAGDVVLFHTGCSDRYHDESYFHEYPVMSGEVADFLVERGVTLIGVDACSVDKEDGFPIHKRLLSGDVLIAENLTNLKALSELERFVVYALPIKLQLDGAPARVFAVSG